MPAVVTAVVAVLVTPAAAGAHAKGAAVITPHGDVGADEAVELRQVLVHAVRRTWPLRMDVELADVGVIDSINIGTLAAVCALADVHHVAVLYTNPSRPLASMLTPAGVPSHRIRC